MSDDLQIPVDKLAVDEPTGAAMIGISPRSLFSLAASGEIPFVKIGSRKLYSVETLRAWIREREQRKGGAAQ